MHIPKTAGMSLRATFAAQYHASEKLPAETWSELSASHVDLKKYKLFVGHYRYWVRDLLPEGTRCVTVLRDPIERSISHLHHLIKDSAFNKLHGQAVNRSIDDIVDDEFVMRHSCNIQTGYLSPTNEPSLIDQKDFSLIDDELFIGQNDLAYAKTKIDELDAVMFVDDLEQDFLGVCELLKLHPPQNLPSMNTRARRGASEGISADALEKIKYANRDDIELYNYARSKFKTSKHRYTRGSVIDNFYKDGFYKTINSDTVFDMSGPLPCYNLWFQEEGAGSYYRWTGPNQSFGLEVKLCSSKLYIVEFHVHKPFDVGNLSASVNGSSAKLMTSNYGGGLSVLYIFYSPSEPDVVSDIRISYDHSHEVENDHRSLGLILHKIKVVVVK